MPALSTSATGSRSCSRWRATTIQAISSPIRARRLASAASCATFSPWGRGRSPASTRCRSAIPSTRRRARWSAASSPASAATAIRSACPRSAARCAFTGAMTAIAWSMPWRWGWPIRTRFSIPRRRASACRSFISARKPAATASTAPAWRRPSSAPTPRKNARPCRSAIRSRKSSCSKPASRSWPKAASSPSRTWARPG
jgi:hypothetical protein